MRTGNLGTLCLVGMAILFGPLPTTRAAEEDTRTAGRQTPIVAVVEKTKDAVVSIAATQLVELNATANPFDELFNLRGPNNQKRRYTRTNLGSGFVIHPDGYVVTNAHVVSRAAQLKVLFADKTEHEAMPVAIDEQHDLAVLKIKAKVKVPAITLGRSDDLLIGETVIAIGNPLGYDHTVTTGIISAVNRTLEVDNQLEYTGLIQTDASINRGNSGGPLLNVLGELIGINTAIRGDAQNICFAIPVDALRKLLPDMLALERSKRLEVGVRLSWRGRPQVVAVSGPAAEAGIEVGDELARVNGQPVKQDIDFYIYLQQITTPDKLDVEIHREGKVLRKIIQPRAIPIPDGGKLLQDKFGLTAKLLTPEQAHELDVQGGLIITQVERGSPAAQAGFSKGLIVVQIGSYFPTDLDEVGLLLENVTAGQQIKFRVYAIQQWFIRVLEGTLTAR